MVEESKIRLKATAERIFVDDIRRESVVSGPVHIAAFVHATIKRGRPRDTGYNIESVAANTKERSYVLGLSIL
jgi:hypothetical protein